MKNLVNIPEIKIGVVAVSRDCFQVSLSQKRLDALAASLKKKGVDFHKCSVVVENEKHALRALKELAAKKCNAAVVYLGNFGPEGPTSLLVQKFPGPVMVAAAAEENKAVLARDRGDALCGLLSLSYNLGLRRQTVFMPQNPVALPEEVAGEIKLFESIARVAAGVRGLKIFSFGPRPHDFLTCHAPLQPLFDLGVEVMENSELDLAQLYRSAASQKQKIKTIEQEMKKELGRSVAYPDLIPKLAQFEVTLMDFMAQNLGASQFGVFANKCWPGFEPEFGFVPCYVNGRMAGKGIPVACEVDLYGALSEYMLQLASLSPATLLDINNSVPDDVLPNNAELKGADTKDLFMGFHCGNTSSSCMKNCALNYQLIMNRLMEEGKTPDITRGTLEGQLKPGPITLFRIQSTAGCHLQSFIAEGEMLDVDPCTFGGTGIVAIPGFSRFYRHVLLEKKFPHHAGLGFRKAGKVLFEALKLLGVNDIKAPLPGNVMYEGENPF
jgi:L-fucose isomerase-like protein